MADLKFKDKPVVIDPYDPIVQKAVQESGLEGVDVVKLEPTCPGTTDAWVTNQDLIKGKPGEERVIHLCLKKIKDRYKKTHGQPISVTDPSQYNQVKDIVKDYLGNIVLPHEKKHVDQVIEHGGKFGPSPELEAEKAEDWQKMQKLHGISKMASQLDVLANILEKKGYVKYSEQLDVIANTIEKLAVINLQGLINNIKRSLTTVPEGKEVIRLFSGKDIDSVLKLLIDKFGNKIDAINFRESVKYAEPMQEGESLAGVVVATTPEGTPKIPLAALLPIGVLIALSSYIAQIPVASVTYADINNMIREFKSTGSISTRGTAVQEPS